MESIRLNGIPKKTYFCEVHKKHYLNEYDYNMHMNSLAHKYFCEIHNKKFNGSQAYEAHMRSPAHCLIDNIIGDKNNIKSEKSEKNSKPKKIKKNNLNKVKN